MLFPSAPGAKFLAIPVNTIVLTALITFEAFHQRSFPILVTSGGRMVH
jgi:hypothetical protein